MDYPGGTNHLIISVPPSSREVLLEERRNDDRSMGVMRFEDGGRGYKPRNTGGHQTFKRPEQDSPHRALRKNWPCHCLDLGGETDFRLLTSRTAKDCTFGIHCKPLNL